MGSSINCENCIHSLIKAVTEHNYCKTNSHSKYFNFKNKEGLVCPSENSFKVILYVEKTFLLLTDNFKKLHVDNSDKKIIIHCINKFLLDSSIFNDLVCENVTIFRYTSQNCINIFLNKKISESKTLIVW